MKYEDDDRLVALLDTGKHCRTVVLNAGDALAIAMAWRAAQQDSDELRYLLAQWVHLIRNSPDRIRRLLDELPDAASVVATGDNHG